MNILKVVNSIKRKHCENEIIDVLFDREHKTHFDNRTILNYLLHNML